MKKPLSSLAFIENNSLNLLFISTCRYNFLNINNNNILCIIKNKKKCRPHTVGMTEYRFQFSHGDFQSTITHDIEREKGWQEGEGMLAWFTTCPSMTVDQVVLPSIPFSCACPVRRCRVWCRCRLGHQATLANDQTHTGGMLDRRCYYADRRWILRVNTDTSYSELEDISHSQRKTGARK